MNHAIPEAPATLHRGRTVFQWIVPTCPFCGKKHVHGGGLLGGDPRTYLSLRTPDCGPGFHAPGSYRLVERPEGSGCPKEAVR